MKRRIRVVATLFLLGMLLVAVPGLSAQARGSDRPGEPGRQFGRVCSPREGRAPDSGRVETFRGPSKTGSRPRCELSGGVLATFEVQGELFRVWVTNPVTIQQILDLQAGTSMANIPNGVVRYGPGQGNHNAPWNWHLDPEQIEMAEAAIELCDGVPSYVEARTQEFVEVVGSFCPWSASLVEVQDLR